MIAHRERHMVQRIGWLRAAVLGANDGIVSTASLICGVAASGASHGSIIISGTAALVAGAMSMAAGEYVSVSSQADAEAADLAKEKWELETTPEAELQELTGIYIKRGLDKPLARQVAEALTKKDALAAHLRDELGIVGHMEARPVQAAWTSAVCFAAGAGLPLLAAYFTGPTALIPVVALSSLVFLAVLGALGARAGGAGLVRPTVRVVFWGALAMGITFAIGKAFGTAIV